MTLVVLIASVANNLKMNNDYLQKFAKNLKRLRKEKGFTQDDLASDGISRSMVSLIEIAKTDLTVSKVKLLADTLGFIQEICLILNKLKGGGFSIRRLTFIEFDYFSFVLEVSLLFTPLFTPSSIASSS